MISAQVVLNASGGEDASSSPANITAENVHRYLPSAENIKKAEEYFSEKGFEVQHGYGNSFSITGSPAQFEKVFKTKLLKTEKGGIKSASKNKDESLELPIDNLSKEMQKIVSAVTFSEPPDFGPTNY